MIAIVDYEAGNQTSVSRALDRLQIKNVITPDPEMIKKAQKIIFPGVGAAGEAMMNLKARGLDEVIKESFTAGKPILGICVGTQVVLGHSEENDTDCLGIIPGEVVRFDESMNDGRGGMLKIPHMGWNQVLWERTHPVFEGVASGSDFYFVHSYYPRPTGDECTIGTTEYGINFSSVIGFKNLVAVQFHAEKSGPPGLQVLENFSRWDGLVEE